MFIKKLFLCIIPAIIVIALVVSGTQALQAEFVKYCIDLNGSEATQLLDYPLISNNDVTYMSIRDVGKLLNRDIMYKPNTPGFETIGIYKKVDRMSISKLETGVTILKAIVSEKFSHLITDRTRYTYGEERLTHMGSVPSYVMCVWFDAPYEIQDQASEVVENADIEIMMSRVTGAFGIHYPKNNKTDLVKENFGDGGYWD